MKNNLRKLKRAFETQKQQREAESFNKWIAELEAREAARREREAFRQKHPVSTGFIPMTAFKEPRWSYSR